MPGAEVPRMGGGERIMTDEQIKMLLGFRDGATFSEWNETKGEVVRYLLNTNRIRADCRVAPDFFVATQSGLAELSKIEKNLNDAAEHKAEERRKERSSLRREIIVAVLSALLTLLVEHFQEVIDVLLRFGKALFDVA